MLGSIFLKAIRDRWRGIVIGAASITLVIWMGVAVYKDIGDEAIAAFELMPEAFLKVMGFDTSLGASGMILSEMVGSVVPFVLIGLLIAMAADAVAGEERWGTAGLLLANPRSRRRMVVEKASALVAMIAFGCLMVWGGYWLALWITNADTTGMHLGSTTIHLAALALFLAGLTFLVGAHTANTTTAVATGTAVMLVSFFAAGLLPLTSWGGSWAKAFPWYYLNGAEPFIHGVAWGHVALLAVLGLVFLFLAVVSFERRDLKVGEERLTLLDRAVRNPKIAKYAEKISGRALTAGIATKSTSDARTMFYVTGGGLFYMAAILGPTFKGVGDKMGELLDAFPPELMAMVGGADYGVPSGYYYGEIFSIMAPIAIAVVAIALAARGLAGEERDRTMGLLLANPVSRTRVVLAKAWGMTLVVFGIAFLTFLGVLAGDLMAGLDLSYTNLTAMCVHLAAFGLCIGAVALFVSALTGISRVAVATGTFIVTAAYTVAVILPINPDLANWVKTSPFYYYSENLPLDNGFDWMNLGILAAASAVFVAASVWVFRRRDLKG